MVYQFLLADIVHFASASAVATGSSRFSHLLRLERLSAMCQRHQVWLVVDNTYEHFTYEEDGRESTAVGAEAMAFSNIVMQSKPLLVDIGCLYIVGYSLGIYYATC